MAEAIVWLEKCNADLEPDLMTAADARQLMAECALAEKLVAYTKTALAPKLNDAEELAKVTGTSVGKARVVVETAKVLQEAEVVLDALSHGDISLDQAAEIAKAEVAQPGAASDLLKTAQTESFQVLREKSRKVVLEAEQKRGLAERQKEARSARSHIDDLGMVNLHLRLEPHVGTTIVKRAEAEAARLYKAAKKDGKLEPFERHLADAYAKIFSASSVKPHSSRPELVILVSHGVAKRGWKDVKDGEHCKIPGLGPVPVEVAKEIADDAFLTGLFYDGTDLRHMNRITRNWPIGVRLALELGEPPDFDGVKCTDCGRRFRPEKDHVEPHCQDGPASTTNGRWRCDPCHADKTGRDRAAGKLTPRAPSKNKPLRR